MADNLTISIGADTSKMQADLRVLKVQIRELGKDLDTAVKAGNPAAINQTAAAYQNLLRQSTALSRELRIATKETESFNTGLKEIAHSGRGLGRVVSEFSNLSRGLESATGILGNLVFGFTGGLLGFAIGKGISALVEQLHAVDEELLKIRETAQQAGVKPVVIQAAQEITKDLGKNADDATKMIVGLTEAIDTARNKAQQTPGAAMIGGPQVMRGSSEAIAKTGETAKAAVAPINELVVTTNGVVEAMRGGAKAAKDFSQGFDALSTKATQFPATEKGKLENIRADLEEFVKQQGKLDPERLNVWSKALFKGVPKDAALEIAPALIARLTKKIEELNAAPRGATDAALKSIDEMKAARAEVQKIFEDQAGGVATWWRGVDTEFNKGAAEFLGKTLPGWSADVQRVFADLWTALGEQKGLADVAAGWMAELPDFQPWIDRTVAAFQGMWDAIAAAAAAARRTLSSSFPGDPSIPAMPMAGGGMIHGPGTGTSDSILARLSNGEFVMRASAVRAWGADFMQGLNAFSDGGLVRPVPRFAAGGLAAAGGGTPVHLHLGGHSFALSGNNGVVGALVIEAQRQQMRSAGVKPSWFAARPGG